MRILKFVGISAIVSLSLAVVPAVFSVTPTFAADVNWKSITAFPRKHPFNVPLANFSELAAKYSNGEIKIRYIGGPDVTPVPEQMKAISRGVLDVYYGPMSYFLGEIPEIQAFNGSNLHAMEVRSTGGLALMNQAVRKRLNAELIGYYGSGYTFYIYLNKKPKFAADGTPDFTGMKLRGVAIYREFFKRFGASAVPMHVAEMYSGLERGIVQGMAWIGPFVTNFGWDKFLKYRITPAYWQGDIIIAVNKDKWDKLSTAHKRAVTRASIESEIAAHAQFHKASEDEKAKLKKGGMIDINLTGKAAEIYSSAAYDIGVWQALAKNKISKAMIEDFKAKLFRK
jgi:TRAP-type C4-dicarboxylate transport system substrate-binding protein